MTTHTEYLSTKTEEGQSRPEVGPGLKFGVEPSVQDWGWSKGGVSNLWGEMRIPPMSSHLQVEDIDNFEGRLNYPYPGRIMTFPFLEVYGLDSPG